jgi:hypothetical protein
MLSSMPTLYTVQEGDCVASIACDAGMEFGTIWQAAENADLRSRRPSPNLLLPGDQITIPDKTPKSQPGASSQRHSFKVKNALVKLRLRFLDDDKPRAKVAYHLIVGTLDLKGETGADGTIACEVPADAHQAVLRLGDAEDGESYVVKLGALPPLKEPSGIQARLANLGFNCGAIDGVIGPRTRKALGQFQQKYDLDVTGEADDTTINELEKRHGS